jgi:hypothetical protein
VHNLIIKENNQHKRDFPVHFACISHLWQGRNFHCKECWLTSLPVLLSHRQWFYFYTSVTTSANMQWTWHKHASFPNLEWKWLNMNHKKLQPFNEKPIFCNFTQNHALELRKHPLYWLKCIQNTGQYQWTFLPF